MLVWRWLSFVSGALTPYNVLAWGCVYCLQDHGLLALDAAGSGDIVNQIVSLCLGLKWGVCLGGPS